MPSLELSLYDSRIFEVLILVHLTLSEAPGPLVFAALPGDSL